MVWKEPQTETEEHLPKNIGNFEHIARWWDWCSDTVRWKIEDGYRQNHKQQGTTAGSWVEGITTQGNVASWTWRTDISPSSSAKADGIKVGKKRWKGYAQRLRDCWQHKSSKRGKGQRSWWLIEWPHCHLGEAQVGTVQTNLNVPLWSRWWSHPWMHLGEGWTV